MNRHVVISGAGMVSPIGSCLSAYWDGLNEGKAGFSEIRRFSASAYRCRYAAMIEDVPSSFGNPPSRKEDLDRATLFLFAAVERAIEAAGIEGGSPALHEALFIVGTSLGGMIKGEAYHEGLLRKGGMGRENRGAPMSRKIDPCECTYYGPATIVSRRLGVRGGLIVVNTGCTSSSHALAMGTDFIRSGRYRRVIVGGTDALCPFVYSGFNCLGILKDKPFDPDTRGLILGEGAGAVVLEELGTAERRKSGPPVFLSGYGAQLGIFSSIGPNGLERALKLACNDASLTPHEIDLINGQSLESSIEYSRHYPALKSFFGERIGSLGFFSLKSLIGHTLGASGIIDCITSYMILKKGEIPAGLATTNAPREKSKGIKAILTTESAFGGNHVALIVSKTKGLEKKHRLRRVVITGRGAIASRDWPPDDNSLVPKGWRVLAPGSLGCGSVKGTLMKEIKGNWISEPSKLSRMDRFCRLGIFGALLCMMDSRLVEDMPSREEMGTVIGTAFGCLLSNERYHQDLVLKGPRLVSPLLFPYTLPSTAPSEIGASFGFRGPAIALTTGWSSGLQSIGFAFEMIRLSLAKRLLAGGVDCLGKILLQGFEDSEIDGALPPLSEGIGIVCLEEMEEAQKRRASIRGEVLGFGTSYCPTGSTRGTDEAVQKAIVQSLDDGAVSLKEIEQIILASGPKGLLARVQRSLLSLIPERKGVLSVSSFQDEAFAATAPLILCVDGIRGDVQQSLLIFAACPTGSFSSLIVKAFRED